MPDRFAQHLSHWAEANFNTATSPNVILYPIWLGAKLRAIEEPPPAPRGGEGARKVLRRLLRLRGRVVARAHWVASELVCSLRPKTI